MAGISETDEQLVAQAAEGDSDALVALVERHLHPAWRIALATTSSIDAAQGAVVEGMCDAFQAAWRSPDPLLALRVRIAAAVHRAAVAVADRSGARLAAGDDPAVAAFRRLPATSRTALWLTDVEGGTPAQAAPVLALERTAAIALVDRARAAYRDLLRSDAAASSDPAVAAALLAAVESPKPALRRLVVAVPDGLPAAVAARWAEVGGRDRRPWLRGWSERAVGAAAAAVFAVGLAGFAIFGGGGGDGAPNLAAPAGAIEETARSAAPTTATTGAFNAALVLPTPSPLTSPLALSSLRAATARSAGVASVASANGAATPAAGAPAAPAAPAPAAPAPTPPPMATNPGASPTPTPGPAPTTGIPLPAPLPTIPLPPTPVPTAPPTTAAPRPASPTTTAAPAPTTAPAPLPTVPPTTAPVPTTLLPGVPVPTVPLPLPSVPGLPPLLP